MLASSAPGVHGDRSRELELNKPSSSGAFKCFFLPGRPSSLGLGDPHNSSPVALESQSGSYRDTIVKTTRGQCCPTHSPWDQSLCVSDGVGFSGSVCVCVCVCGFVCVALCVWLCVSSMRLFIQASLYAVVHFCSHLSPPVPTSSKSMLVTQGTPGTDKGSTASPHVGKDPCHRHHHHETRCHT